jgi:hypothetical protein
MLEIGFRSISWTMAIHLLAGDKHIEGLANTEPASSCVTARCLVALERQLTHVEEHLSHYFSPNTHLTGEALALYVVGQAFPELASSGRWVDTGRRILVREIDRQILPDGGHVERSMHYQRYTLDFYLLALLTARRAGDVDTEHLFANAAARLADFTHSIADDEGRLPLIGDDDGGMLWPIAGRDCADVRDSLAIAAVALHRPDLASWGVQEEAFWIAAPEAIRCADDASVGRLAPRSRVFADTGYVVMRSDHDHAVLDTGPHGYMNGGHAHADALSLTLSVDGRPLLVDPGTSTYTMDRLLRDRMRGSFSHNTVSIDDKPQSIAAGPFHWIAGANARLQASALNPCFDWAEGAHDGYAPLEHRRSVIRADDAGWLVVDEIRDSNITSNAGDCIAAHSAATHWQFHPGWMLREEAPRALRATHLDGAQEWLIFDSGDVSLIHGDEESGLGWYAPVYGTLLPTWCARIIGAVRPRSSMLSWIAPAYAQAPPILHRLVANADPHGDAIAARVVNGDVASVFLLRPGEPPLRDGRACGIAEYQTDGRVLHVRTRGDALVALDLVDASHALALRPGWLSVAAGEPIPDLHIQLNDDMLQLFASEPPAQLQILGRPLKRLRAIRLNGRDHSVASLDQPDSLVISGADWTAASLVRSGVRFALDHVHPVRV